MGTSVFLMVLPNHSTVTLATVIREAAEAAGHNPHSLAAHIHRPRNTIKESLAGTRPFNSYDLFAIAEVLGVKLSELCKDAEQRAAA